MVFSGGEPQMNSDLAAISHLLRTEGVRLTLLTAGLFLEAHARAVAETIDDAIVSLEGPPDIYDFGFRKFWHTRFRKFWQSSRAPEEIEVSLCPHSPE
jgi:organic radical activating enzyme